jgi:hypothetical protein
MRMSSGHGQSLLKAGWEANGCLQDVVRVCMVFGEKTPDPLVFFKPLTRGGIVLPRMWLWVFMLPLSAIL